MTLHTLFQRLLGTRRPGSATSGHGDAAAKGLWQAAPRLDPRDVEKAIAQHHAWCRLFNEHLGADPEDGPLPTDLPDADSSELGQWIAGLNQSAARSHPLLIELEQENRRVHRVALQALDFARHQRMDIASNLLNREFERSCSRVLEILRSLSAGS